MINRDALVKVRQSAATLALLEKLFNTALPLSQTLRVAAADEQSEVLITLKEAVRML